MIGHAVVHRAPGVSLRTHLLTEHVRRHAGERRDSIATLLFEAQRRVWMTEEEARHGRRRSLIDDNPAAG